MPDCQSLEPLFTPYVDGEIAGADRAIVDEHVRVCAPCHSRMAAERAVRELVRARAPQLTPAKAPDALAARCAEIASASARADSVRAAADRRLAVLGVRLPTGARSAKVGARLTPLALAASLVLIVGGAFVYQATDMSVRVMAAELTADHIKCFAMNRVLGTHQGAPAVESSMAASFGWRMHLPENPARAGLELVGARPCLYGEGKIAHIMYRHQGRPVSLFMLPATARTPDLVDVLGHEAAVWCVGNRTFVLIAREPRHEVQRLVSFVQSALR